MHKLRISVAVRLLTALVIAAHAVAASSTERVDYVQGWLGVMATEDAATRNAPSTGETLVADLGTLPFGAGAAQRLWSKGPVQLGLEGGGLATWKGKDWRFSSSDGELEVTVRGSFFSIGVFMGGVVSVKPHTNLRLYLAAGPSLTWAILDRDKDDDQIAAANIIVSSSDNSADVSFVPYARAGFEVLLDNGLAIGVSARYARDEFDFDDTASLDVDETLWLLTLGAQL
jgi:hypothetical protein